MASKKKESEGIALLSMYGDESDDDTEQDPSDNEAPPLEQNEVGANEAADILTSPPAQQVIGAKPGRGRKRTLKIVDYGHDEAALSPEPEEGEIAATGRVMFGAELQTVNGTPPGTVQRLTRNTRSTPQSSEHADQSQSDAMNYKGIESESAAPEEAANVAEDGDKKMDPLEKFLPPPPMTKCTDELQGKFIKFLMLEKKTGRSYNSEVCNRKEYRNPDFLLHAATYQDIDATGSCFSKDVFDPHACYDEIEEDMKKELERKEQEKKKNQKIDFLSGGTQSVAFPIPKRVPNQGVPPLAGGGSNPVSAAVDTGTSNREGRPNKKSKWV